MEGLERMLSSRTRHLLYFFCLLITDLLFLSDVVYCDEATNAIQTPTVLTKLKVECLTISSDAKGFYVLMTRILYECSKHSCAGFIGCEKCCDLSDEKIASRDQNDANVLQIPVFKDPIFLVLLTILVTITTITACCYVMTYCSICIKKWSKNSATSDENHELAKSTQTHCYKVTSFDSKKKCDKIPKIKMKLGGRSCKVQPNSALQLPSNSNGEANEMKGRDINFV